jgi:hypothetical protein
MALDTELQTYQRELPNLLPKVGKWALVHGDAVLSTWSTYEDALQEGYRVVGLHPFLVKQIQPVDVVHHTTRGVIPICRS